MRSEEWWSKRRGAAFHLMAIPGSRRCEGVAARGGLIYAISLRGVILSRAAERGPSAKDLFCCSTGNRQATQSADQTREPASTLPRRGGTAGSPATQARQERHGSTAEDMRFTNASSRPQDGRASVPPLHGCGSVAT